MPDQPLDPDLIHDAATDTGHNGIHHEIHEMKAWSGTTVAAIEHLTVTMTSWPAEYTCDGCGRAIPCRHCESEDE